IVRTIKEAIHPHLREEVRPILRFVAEYVQPGDIACTFATDLEFRYYAPRLGLPDLPHVPCEIGPPQACSALTELRGRRVWFFFAHARVTEGINYESQYVNDLSQIG